jgi:hypothetical protein
LLDEMDQLVIKMKAAHQDFDTRVGICQGAGVRVCDDAEALLHLQTGGSVHARAKVVVKEINDLVARLQQITGTKLTAAAGAASGVDLMDLVSRLPGVLADKMPAIQKDWNEMQAAWAAAGCGKPPAAKTGLVTVNVQVVDKSGAPAKDAQGLCGGKAFQGSKFTVVIPLNKNDAIEATASAPVPGTQFTVTDATRPPRPGTARPIRSRWS